MKHFYLLENNTRGKLPNAKQMMAEYLTSKGAVVTLEEIKDDTECIIVLGGDGTMLKAAAKTIGKNIPIIGINAGRLGYLTSISEEEEIIPMLDKLLGGEFEIEKRSMIQGEWEDEEGKHCEYALNDINILRRAELKTVPMAVSVCGELLNEYIADGIIVATPTGSTAYNLSAGGPIVEVRSNVMIITPICPHAFLARSMVVSMDDVVDIGIVDEVHKGGTFVELAFDGAIKGKLKTSANIKITKSEYTVPLIRLKGDSYYKTLRRKMEQLHG